MNQTLKLRDGDFKAAVMGWLDPASYFPRNKEFKDEAQVKVNRETRFYLQAE